MKIYIGADHNGFELKESLKKWLIRQGHSVVDVGNKEYDPHDDFPIYASKLVHKLQASKDKDAFGILVCGSGQGVAIAANRFRGIRAGVIWNESEARAVRNDDDGNVLCLPARELRDESAAKDIVTTWVNTPFSGAPRYHRRIKQLDDV